MVRGDDSTERFAPSAVACYSAGVSTSARAYRAVIFDMDGVIADSEPVYLEAANAVLAPRGHRLTPEQNQQLIGTSVSHTWRSILDLLHLDGDLQAYVAEYDRHLVRLLREVREPLPGVLPLIDELKRRRIPLGLATSSWEGWVDALLGGLGLRDAFDAIVWREMVEHAKPAPDLYLKAASMLGVQPEDCIALEDTPSGIEAARAAGMFAIQVRAASTAFPPIPQADLVLDRLLDFPLHLLVSPS